MLTLQDVLDMYQKEEEKERTSKMFTIGKLITSLELFNSTYTIILNFTNKNKTYYASPTELLSYRGYYSDLAIDYVTYTSSNAITISSFITKLKRVLYKELLGYKGGKYKMKKSTPVWFSHYSEVSQYTILSITENKEEEKVYINITKQEEY